MRFPMLVLLAVISPLPAACVSMGPDYDPAAVESLKPGMDRAEVIALLGRPSSRATLSDGSQYLMWIHSKGTMFGAKARALTLIFGPDGKYQRVSSESESTIR